MEMVSRDDVCREVEREQSGGAQPEGRPECSAAVACRVLLLHQPPSNIKMLGLLPQLGIGRYQGRIVVVKCDHGTTN